jgi:hypothetical protein
LDAAAKSDNAPTGLKTPGAPGQGAGGSGVLGAANSVLGAYNTGKGLFDMAKDIGSFLALAHGGVASRYGYEEGGDVFKDNEDDEPENVSDESTKPDVEVPDKLPIPQVKSDQKLAVAPEAPPPMEPIFDSLIKIGSMIPKAYGGALTDHHIAHALRLAMGGTARHGYQEGGDPSVGSGDPNDQGVLNSLSQDALDAANAAKREMDNPDASRVVKYAVAPALYGASMAASTIPASLNWLLSPSSEPFYPKPAENANPNAGMPSGKGDISPYQQFRADNGPIDLTPWKSPTPGLQIPWGNNTTAAQSPRVSAPPRPQNRGLVPKDAGSNKAPPTTPFELPPDRQATLQPAGGDALTTIMPNVYAQMMQPSLPGVAGLQPQAGPSDTGQGGDFMTRAGDWVERQLGINQGKPGTSDTWMGRNEDWLVPLLKGVGTMASSPSRYFGGALLQGVGAAAQAVPDLQTQQSQVALRQAQATHELADAGRGGMVPVLHTLPNGQTQLEYVDITKLRGNLKTNKNGQYVIDDRVNPPSADNYDNLGDVGKQSAAKDAANFFMLTRMNPDSLKMSNEKINEVYNEAASGANNTRQLKKFAETMTGQTGTFEPGKLNPFMTNLAAWWDSIAPNLGLQGVKLEQLANSQEAEKLSRSIAASGEANADQRSFAALKSWMQMTPSGVMTKPAAMNLITKMYVDNQRAVDEGNYFNEYDKYSSANKGIPGLYSGQNAESAFRRDYSDDRYMSEQAALANVLSDAGTMKMLENPDPKIRAAVIQSIEKKNPSLRNFGRYFSTAWSEGRQG